jgi:HlyD family secretion protein
MVFNPKRWILPAIITVVLVAAWWYGATRPIEVDVKRVTVGSIKAYIEEEGETAVVDRFVLSAPVAGRLLRVAVEEGDAVAKGDVLGEIDPLALRARVDEAKAKIGAIQHRMKGIDTRRPTEDEIAHSRLLERRAGERRDAAEREITRAKAAFEQAKRDADRARELVTDGTITKSEKEEAELAETAADAALNVAEVMLKIRTTEMEAAKVATKVLIESARDVDWEEASLAEQLKEIRAGLEVLTDDLARAKIVSPIDGVVLRRHRESEAVLAAGTPVVTVGDVTKLEIMADLLSEDAARLKPGLPVEIVGRALGERTLTGRLRTIRPGAFTKISSLGVEQQRVAVVVDFEPDGTNLGDAYRVDVRIVLAKKDEVPLVPETALFRSGGKWRAFRVEDGRARLVTVETGLRDGRRREVIAGLAEGDTVILHPDDSLEEGARIMGAVR